MKTNIILTLTTLFFLTTSSVITANDESSTGYVGFSYGKTKFDTDIDSSEVDSLDESDTGFKVFAGTNINDNFAVEAHYANLGEILISDSGIDFKAENKSYGIAGVFKFTNDAFTPFVKLGWHKWDTDVIASNGVTTITASEDGSDVFYGVGVNAEVTQNIDIRAEFERFKFGDDTNSSASIGIIYNF